MSVGLDGYFRPHYIGSQGYGSYPPMQGIYPCTNGGVGSFAVGLPHSPSPHGFESLPPELHHGGEYNQCKGCPPGKWRSRVPVFDPAPSVQSTRAHFCSRTSDKVGHLGTPCPYISPGNAFKPFSTSPWDYEASADLIQPPYGDHLGSRNQGVPPFGTDLRRTSGEKKETSRKRRRNNERRKEKSRDAARSRRGRESEIFAELGELLPLESPLSASLDKASVIRVAIAYLRTRSLVAWGLEIPLTSSKTPFSDKVLPGLFSIEGSQTGGKSVEEGILGALDGFLLVLTEGCDIVYTSKNIATFLGLQQMDVVGHSLLDYTHPCDHDEARRLSGLVADGPDTVFLRFKCTLTPKGRNVNLKSASYKVVQVTGQVLKGADSPVNTNTPNWEGEGTPSLGGGSWIVSLGVPVPHPSNIEVPLDKQTFVSKHSLDMKFTYVDENILEFCGYRPDELLGRSLYQVNHALDTQIVTEAYKTLRCKGQVETGRYRFLSRGGGFVWVVTQATLINGQRDNKPQSVVCLNYVISHIECQDVIFSECQLEASKSCPLPDTCPSPTPGYSLHPTGSSVPPLPVTLPSPCVPCPLAPVPAAGENCRTPPSPVAATCLLLRDRTEDMNEGYLTFSDNFSHLTVLKDEPEDLTHLAPSVGEDCLPFETSVFLPGFDDFLDSPSPGEFELPKLTPSTHPYEFKNGDDTSFERLLRQPSISPIKSPIPKFKTGEGLDCPLPAFSGVSPSLAPAVQAPDEPKGQIGRNSLTLRRQSQLPPEIKRLDRAVPDKSTTSPGSGVGSPGARFDTPEPPFSPLLSQAASRQTLNETAQVSSHIPNEWVSNSSPPSLFTPRYEDNSSDPAMDFLNSLDLKLEEDSELQAPYIAQIDEMLVFDQEDIFGLSSPTDNQENLPDDGSYIQFRPKYEGSASSIVSPTAPPCSPQNSFGHTKMATDTGGSFVDPNQVLPGQFYIKGEEKDNLQELRCLLEAPPPSPVKEPVNPPPPLRAILSPHSYCADKGNQKRRPSLAQPPPTKRLRTTICSSSTSPTLKKEISMERVWASGQSRDLPTPNAPLMQQLLVSKEPVFVRGRVVSTPSPPSEDGGLAKRHATASQSHAHTHSVLRNLLVSGRDERAGYAVLVSNLSSDNEGTDAEGNKSNDDSSLSPDSLPPLHSFPLNKKGKIELTRQQLAALLNKARVLRPAFQSAPLTPPEETPSPSSCSPATPSTPTFQEVIEDKKALQQPQSSLFVIDSIPTPFDFASFDSEETRPTETDGTFLQDSELLMALEGAIQH